MAHADLSAARLRSLLSYDSNTGIFHWRENRGSRHIGDVAGCLNPAGYVFIGVDGVLYLAHRLAWLYVHDEFPKNWIDHRDQQKTNNRIDNLRQATCPENMANTGIRSTNKSGFKGVSWDVKNQKWRATITIAAKQQSLGRHRRLEEAVIAYQMAAKRVHPEFYELEAA